MGNYEHIETSASVTWEFHDSERVDVAKIDRILLSYLKPDLLQASLLTDNEESFVHPMLDLINPKKGTTK
jgi:hypothetical protein